MSHPMILKQKSILDLNKSVIRNLSKDSRTKFTLLENKFTYKFHANRLILSKLQKFILN